MAALLAAATASAPAGASEEPKLPAGVGPAPLSAAERQAVPLVVAYLQQGASAWVSRLAPGSPLAALPADAARDEMAVRLGPPAGARWWIQRGGPAVDPKIVMLAIELPSGMDEMARLELDDQGRIVSLQALCDHAIIDSRPPQEYDRIAALRPDDGPVPGATRADSAASALALLGVLAVAASCCSVLGQVRGGATRLAGLLAALLVAGGGLSCRQEKRVAAAAAKETDALLLRTLLPLRVALASENPVDVKPLFDALPKTGQVAEVARLWRIDLLLRQFQLNEANALLTSFAEPSPYPMAELLRARLASVRGDGDRQLLSYERLREYGFDHEGLRLEAAQGFAALGLDDHSEKAYARLTALGARLGDPYFASAEKAIVEERTGEAEAYFRAGWKQQPLTRENLFDNPALAYLTTNEKLFELFDFPANEEPRVGRAAGAREPIAFSAGAKPSISGELLRVAVDKGELLVPGGALLAPPDAEVESPSALARRERDAALAQLPTLTAQLSSPGALAQPALLRRVESAGLGLLVAERWNDLLALTAQLPSFPGRLPPLLTRLRAVALRHANREPEAFDLLLRLAKNDKAHGRRDVGTLYQIADVLVRKQEYTLALKVLRRANVISGARGGQARIAQVEMEQQLALSHRELVTDHFRLRYPENTDVEYARQLSIVLEEEHERLQRWIPLSSRSAQLIDVDLYPLREFLAAYSSVSLVVGIFDGRVRVPFADLGSLDPELVSILSHELAHAMITQATHDRAPRWLQEGLAQHVEMVQDVVNPIPDLRRENKVLALSVVEAALGSFSEQQFVELSYGEAAWAVHYLEAEKGVAGIHRLLAELAVDQPVEDALRRALGMDYAELDRRFWAWSETAPKVWPAQLRRYDQEAEELLLRRGNEAAPTKVTGAGQGFGGLETRKDTNAAMAAWHTRYAGATRAVKAALGPVIASLGQTVPPADLRQQCQTLSTAVLPVISDRSVLAAPTPAISRPLSAAYDAIHRLSNSCLAADHAGARAQLRRAEQKLGEAAGELARYQLRP